MPEIRVLARFSALVFSGSVKKIEPVPGAKSSAAQAVTFEVERVWKGAPSKQFVVYNVTNHTETSFSDVGFPIQKGSRYIVFANRQTPEERAFFGLPTAGPTVFGLGACGGGTRLYEEAKTEVARLGPGRALSPK